MSERAEVRKAKFRSNLGTLLIVTIAPPACATAAYFMASKTGCSGGDCTGMMMAVMLLGVVAFLIGAVGALTAAILVINEFWSRLADHYASRARKGAAPTVND